MTPADLTVNPIKTLGEVLFSPSSLFFSPVLLFQLSRQTRVEIKRLTRRLRKRERKIAYSLMKYSGVFFYGGTFFADRRIEKYGKNVSTRSQESIGRSHGQWMYKCIVRSLRFRRKHVLIEGIMRSTFTPKGKRKFVPRDEVFPLIVVHCFLLLHRNKWFHASFIHKNCSGQFLSV